MELSDFEKMGYREEIADGKFVFERGGYDFEGDGEGDRHLFLVTQYESSSIKRLYSGTCYSNALLMWEAVKLAYFQGVRDEYKRSPWGVPVPTAEDSGSFTEGTEGKNEPQENTHTLEDILNERDNSGVYYYDGNIGGINRDGVGRIPDWEWQGLTPSSIASKIDAIDQSVLAKRKQLEEYESGI